jgi:hypothetical protein
MVKNHERSRAASERWNGPPGLGSVVILAPGLGRRRRPRRQRRQCYSTVTDFARFLGWSASLPMITAV